ncbi:MAG: dipeptidase [Bacilli bacterium]
MEDWKSFLAANQNRFLFDFIEFLSIPSLSTLPEYRVEVNRAAEWLASRMKAAGLENVEVLETAGHPVVYGDWLHADGAPTLLLYGHYDVQPADPLELWVTPPFEPDIRDGRIYARGASDMKGNVLLMLQACEAHLATTGKLPVNVKLLIEGEEEIGSPSLPYWLANHQDKVSCDFAASSDSSQIGQQEPTIIVGAKGLCGIQIDIKTAASDLHSGIAGGIVYNALHVLSGLIASMHHAETTRVSVQGFYDDVIMPASEDREMCALSPLNANVFRQSIGVSQLISEPDFTPLESTWFRPTLEVNGMWGGFQGAGIKTIIPCEAHAKITCRLVANQQPKNIIEKLKEHVREHTPAGVEVSVSPLSGLADPYVVPSHHPALQAADTALQDEMGSAPVHMRMGATVPVLGMLKDLLGVEVISLGFSGISDNIHAPNEFVDLALYKLGPHVYARFFEQVAHLQQ